jgi:hypothetical protein
MAKRLGSAGTTLTCNLQVVIDIDLAIWLRSEAVRQETTIPDLVRKMLRDRVDTGDYFVAFHTELVALAQVFQTGEPLADILSGTPVGTSVAREGFARLIQLELDRRRKASAERGDVVPDLGEAVLTLLRRYDPPGWHTLRYKDLDFFRVPEDVDLADLNGMTPEAREEYRIKGRP